MDWQTRPPQTEWPRCPQGHAKPPWWDAVAEAWTWSVRCEVCVEAAMVAGLEAERRAVVTENRRTRQAELARKYPSQYNLEEGLYQGMSLLAYQPQTARQREALAYALALVTAWQAGQREGVLFMGRGVGLGKTHLAVSLLKEARELDLTASIWSMPYYLRAIKDTYENGGTAELAEALEGVDVLCLDDIGAEYTQKPEWLERVYFDLLDRRAVERRVLVATTNLADSELAHILGPRSYSRFRMLVGVPVELDGTDYRLRLRSQA